MLDCLARSLWCFKDFFNSDFNRFSFFSDDDDDSLFKSAMPKVGKTVRNLANEEEEDEDEDEEVSMKGRPPPAPLFGDDDDEDDFDWLG